MLRGYVTIPDKYFYNYLHDCVFKSQTNAIKNFNYVRSQGGNSMDIHRIKQIVGSSNEVDVTYNGVSVWIDQIHENGKMATVHLRHSLEERSEVDIAELEEVVH